MEENRKEGEINDEVKGVLAVYCVVVLIPRLLNFFFGKDFYAVKHGRKCYFISFCWE